MEIIRFAIECIRSIWIMICLILFTIMALPGLMEQAEYEEKVEKGEIG
jgi:hypothetical protein